MLNMTLFPMQILGSPDSDGVPEPRCYPCGETLAEGNAVVIDGDTYCRDCASEEMEIRREEETQKVRAL